MSIKKVLICGLGALGITYASKLMNICELKILADNSRIQKYKKNKPILNNKILELDYITQYEDWNPDLIIITTKSTALDSVLELIKNFVKENTIIISLINGISSEYKIASIYGKEKVVKSFFIGHSAIRIDNKVSQDGEGKIVLEKNKKLEEFFDKNNIKYDSVDDIEYFLWLKLGVNIILNQPSAIYEMNVGEMKKQKDYKELSSNLLKEVKEVAKKCGLENLDNFEEEVFKAVDLVSDSGVTSMYQDIMAKRKTEVDIFSGEIIRLGNKHNIPTPYNKKIYEIIKKKEENFL